MSFRGAEHGDGLLVVLITQYLNSINIKYIVLFEIVGVSTNPPAAYVGPSLDGCSIFFHSLRFEIDITLQWWYGILRDIIME